MRGDEVENKLNNTLDGIDGIGTDDGLQLKERDMRKKGEVEEKKK